MTRPRHLDDPDHYRDEREHPVNEHNYGRGREIPVSMSRWLEHVPPPRGEHELVPGTRVRDRAGQRGRVTGPVSDLPRFVWVTWDGDGRDMPHLAMPVDWLTREG